MDQFFLHKLAFQITRHYFNEGYGVELATRNAVVELMALAPWMTAWEAGKLADRAWMALQKQRDAARN